MQPNTLHSSWMEIDLEAIRRNAGRLHSYCRTGVMAVVKAGAYGHGGAMAARAALRGGAEWLGVARVEEGLELRRQGIVAPLLILGFTRPERLAEALEAKLSLTVWRMDHLEAASAAASASGRKAGVHLKVDTGMNRIGAPPAEALALAGRIRQLPALVGEGVYTHFARADEADRTPTMKQQAIFAEVVQSLDGAGLRPQWIHAANTAGALAYPEARWDLVRCGVGIYGMHPSSDVRLPDEFEPALQWKSALTEVKVVAAGSGVSYGHTYVTRRDERIGTIPVGYADGFRRVTGHFVLAGGKRVPIVGRVCMDQCMVQLDAVPGARPGDEVVLLGAQGGERISAEEIAQRWGTVNYEVTCGITERVARVYR